MNRARRYAALISSGLAALGVITSVAYSLTNAYAPARTLRFASASGWLAGSLLALALCVSPLLHLLERLGRSRPSWLAHLRRSLGIAAASCGFVHAAFAFLVLPGVSALVFSIAWLRAGLTTLAILLALLATSFEPILRRLRLQHWKELHRLVYPAAILLALHVILGPFGSAAIEVSFFSLIVVLLLLRVWPRPTPGTRSND